MIDIGANLGYFSLLWASARLDNRCFSFEASPRNEEMLRRNVTRNLLDSQIQIYPVAAGKEYRRMEFDLGPPEQTGWGGFSSGAAAHPVTVAAVRVDQVLDLPGILYSFRKFYFRDTDELMSEYFKRFPVSNS